MQTSFLEAFLRIRQCEATNAAGFFAWVRSIAEHNLIDAIRGLRCEKRPQPNRRVETVAPGDSYTALHDLLIGYSTTGSRVAARHEAAGLLEAAIAKLPAEYARVVRLFDLEGVAAAEIGATIGKSRGAVYMIRARALGRLQDLLGTDSKFFSHLA
jgi:RNA polymerase sigma factor (sigma-70 family)